MGSADITPKKVEETGIFKKKKKWIFVDLSGKKDGEEDQKRLSCARCEGKGS